MASREARRPASLRCWPGCWDRVPSPEGPGPERQAGSPLQKSGGGQCAASGSQGAGLLHPDGLRCTRPALPRAPAQPSPQTRGGRGPPSSEEQARGLPAALLLTAHGPGPEPTRDPHCQRGWGMGLPCAAQGMRSVRTYWLFKSTYVYGEYIDSHSHLVYIYVKLHVICKLYYSIYNDLICEYKNMFNLILNHINT